MKRVDVVDGFEAVDEELGEELFCEALWVDLARPALVGTEAPRVRKTTPAS